MSTLRDMTGSTADETQAALLREAMVAEVRELGMIRSADRHHHSWAINVRPATREAGNGDG